MGFGETTSEEIERVAHEIVDAAFKITPSLGRGCWSRRIEQS